MGGDDKRKYVGESYTEAGTWSCHGVFEFSLFSHVYIFSVLPLLQADFFFIIKQEYYFFH